MADRLRPVIRSFLGAEPPLEIRFWDGSALGYAGTAAIVFCSPSALTRLLYAPGELGFCRAYVAGDLELEGDIYEILQLRDLLAARTAHADLTLNARTIARLIRAAVAVGAVSRPLRPPPEEVKLRGRLHSKLRDTAAVAHHYDVGNDFYRLVLGETMSYSCAYFERNDVGLDEAQEAKYDLVCRKLRLRPGLRLLDVGCGWGGMVLHAARWYDVCAVGITLSRAQAKLAAKRVAQHGLSHRIEIRYQDYRETTDGPFDAISSIGMFEHVGLAQVGRYFETLRDLLKPTGLLLNHAISKPSGKPGFNRNSFVSRYVFPDGELHEVGSVVTAMQERGLEVRDVESLREHYSRTLRAWVANLEGRWDEAVRLVGPARAKVWRLYMAASALGFDAGRINVHQVVAVKPDRQGSCAMPMTRDSVSSSRGSKPCASVSAERPAAAAG